MEAAPPLTFVFAVRPAAFATSTFEGSMRGAGRRGLVSVAVVNGRHGVDPIHSVLLRVTGSPAALLALARRLSIDDRQDRDLRARIAVAASGEAEGPVVGHGGAAGRPRAPAGLATGGARVAHAARSRARTS